MGSKFGKIQMKTEKDNIKSENNDHHFNQFGFFYSIPNSWNPEELASGECFQEEENYLNNIREIK